MDAYQGLGYFSSPVFSAMPHHLSSTHVAARRSIISTLANRMRQAGIIRSFHGGILILLSFGVLIPTVAPSTITVTKFSCHKPSLNVCLDFAKQVDLQTIKEILVIQGKPRSERV